MNKINKCPLSIKFFLYEHYKKSETEHPLYLRLILNRIKADISLSKLVNPNEWDEESDRFKDTSKHNRYQNNHLYEIEEKLIAGYQTLSKEHETVSVHMVKDLFLGKLDIHEVKLLDFFDAFIHEVKNKPGEYTNGTINNYVATRNHLSGFLSSSNLKNVMVKDFNKKMVMDFETKMLSTKMKTFDRPMSKNSSNKYLTKLKTVLINAKRKGIILLNPFEDFKIKNTKTNKVFLTKEEIQVLKDHQLGDNLSLQRVRDIFLFSVYTGLRYSDAINLTMDKIIMDDSGTYWITTYQNKTHEPIEIPVLNYAIEIMKKYEHLQKTTGKVLPQLSNQKINCYLKEIARIAGISKKITHHCGRHTFGTTIMLEGDVDIKTVSRFLGHSSLKSTEVYARITRKHLSNVVARLNVGNI